MAASASPSSDDDPFAIGTVLDGRYRIEAVLGTGGMGRVYRAAHTSIGKSVAIKVLHATLTRNREASQRFQREAIASGRLDHANIIRVSDFGFLDSGACFLVMEVLEGETLGDRLDRDQRIGWREAVEILRGLLHGLSHAHERGVVHRDIKPDNVYLARGEGEQRVKVLDFGIAKLFSGGGVDPVSTRAGLTVGTPAYLSPEQAVGGLITPASDLYSASVVMYEMLVGRAPFEDRDPLAMLGAHVGREPPRFAEVAPDVQIPAALEDIVQHGLCKLLAERIASASDYLALIDERWPSAYVPPRMATPPSGALALARAATLPADASAIARAATLPRGAAVVRAPQAAAGAREASHAATAPPRGTGAGRPARAATGAAFTAAYVEAALDCNRDAMLAPADEASGPAPAGAPQTPGASDAHPVELRWPSSASAYAARVVGDAARAARAATPVPGTASEVARSEPAPPGTERPASEPRVASTGRAASEPSAAGSGPLPSASNRSPAMSVGVRAGSRGEIAEPIPLSWIIRSGAMLGLLMIAAVALAIVGHCRGGDTRAPAAAAAPAAQRTPGTPAAAGSDSRTAPAAASSDSGSAGVKTNAPAVKPASAKPPHSPPPRGGVRHPATGH